jgi:hypothetical protein
LAARKNKCISLSDRLEFELSAAEVELLHEIIRILRSARYGSVSLTVHDGRLVEIQKLERFRITIKTKKVISNVEQPTTTKEASYEYTSNGDPTRPLEAFCQKN